MTLRDIQILAYSRPSRRIKQTLVRIVSDPWPDNYAVWDRTGLEWVERWMSRKKAQSWCEENSLPDMTKGCDAEKAS